MPDLQALKIGLKYKPLGLMIMYELVTDKKTSRCRKIPLKVKGLNAMQLLEELLARPNHSTLLSTIPKRKLLSIINRIPNIEQVPCPPEFEENIEEEKQSSVVEAPARAPVRPPSRASQQVMEALLNSDTDDDDSIKSDKSTEKENTEVKVESEDKEDEQSARESSVVSSYTDPSDSISENLSEVDESSLKKESANESDEDFSDLLKTMNASAKKKTSNIPIFSDDDSESDSASEKSDSDDSFMRNLNQAKAHKENRSSTPSNVSEVDSIMIDENKNLNLLSDNELEKVKKSMDVNFEANQVTKDDEGFKYDTREEFNPTAPSGWDSDESF